MAQRILVQDPALLESGLVGFDATWPDGWVFPHSPGTVIENTQKCMLILREETPWTDSNAHNRAEFGTLAIDVWADPTRNTDKSMRFDDARDKIKTVGKIIMRNFHLVHPSVSVEDPSFMGAPGMPRIWGTATEVDERTGLTIVESKHSSGPSFAPMGKNPGGYLGVYKFNIQYSS